LAGGKGCQPIHEWFLGVPLLYWFSWAIGAVVADAHVAGRPLPFGRHSVVLWGVMAIGSCFIKALACFSFTLFALMTATFIAKLLQKNYLEFMPNFLSKPLRFVGILSYSLYLLHYPFLQIVPRIADLLPVSICPRSYIVLALCMGMVVPIVALAAVWHKFIELPGIAAGKRLIRRFNPLSKTPSVATN
jgi:peptidoglycan/LPS O-acetylase OafA/YrhL